MVISGAALCRVCVVSDVPGRGGGGPGQRGVLMLSQGWRGEEGASACNHLLLRWQLLLQRCCPTVLCASWVPAPSPPHIL
jgi:hypothetical protein